MSHSTTDLRSPRKSPIKMDADHLTTIVGSSDKIRQGVEDRHWQLFEVRLKKQLPDVSKENYTVTNDYRIIDRLKTLDQPRTPIEPNQRWETFCHQVTNKSNETNRVMSIFHNVWQKNWRTKPTNDIPKRRMTDPMADENTFLNRLSTNDNDRKRISSILHRASSSERFSSANEKTNPV